MTIAFLSPSAERGGAETVLLDILRGVRKVKPDYELHLIAAADGPLVRGAKSVGVECHLLPFPRSLACFGDAAQSTVRSGGISRSLQLLRLGLVSLVYARRLRRRLHAIQPHIIHSNGMKMHLLSAVARPRNKRVRLIWHLHDYLSGRPMMSRLLRLGARHCDLVVANSESVADDARRGLPNARRIAMIYNSVDLDRFSPVGPKADLDELAGVSPAVLTIRVGLIATFAFWKGHEVFLRSIRRLKDQQRCEGIAFYIIGGPLYSTAASQVTKQDLLRLADELQISDLLRFTGFCADVASAMRALDIIVHASTEPEPFGLVIIQAMASGRALISTATGGARELIEPEVNAVAIPPRNEIALADAIHRCASDPELRARVKLAARCDVERHFSSERMINLWAAEYQTLATAA